MECTNILSSMLHCTTNNLKGADDFLPSLIYVIIKSKVTQIISKLNIIEEYRDPKALQASYSIY